MTAEAISDQGSATVWITASGAPERLIWSDRRFWVVSKPVPWMDRKAWWEFSPRVPAGTAADILEQPMWQVQARAVDNAELLIFDLVVKAGSEWPVAAVFK